MDETNLEALYENYQDNFKKGKEYDKKAKELSKKYDELLEKYSEDEMEDINEFEQCLTAIFEMEVKDAFKGGFNAAMNLLTNVKENKDS